VVTAQDESPQMIVEDDMIEILTDFPDNVVAASASGVVTRQDYQNILEPRIELTIKRHPKIRCYYELGSQFSGMQPGAMWEDFKIGVEYLLRWERVAVVTDIEWIRHTFNIFRFLMPGEIRLFATSEAAAAREWVAAAAVAR
jgi:SpoIIAA-like